MRRVFDCGSSATRAVRSREAPGTRSALMVGTRWFGAWRSSLRTVPTVEALVSHASRSSVRRRRESRRHGSSAAVRDRSGRVSGSSPQIVTTLRGHWLTRTRYVCSSRPGNSIVKSPGRDSFSVPDRTHLATACGAGEGCGHAEGIRGWAASPPARRTTATTARPEHAARSANPAAHTARRPPARSPQPVAGVESAAATRHPGPGTAQTRRNEPPQPDAGGGPNTETLLPIGAPG